MEERDWSRTWSSTRPPIAGRSTTWPSRPTAAWWPAPASTATCGCGAVDRPAETFRDFEAQWGATGRPRRRLGGIRPPDPPPGPESARRLAFTPDGTRLVVASTTTVSVWRIEDSQLVRRIERAHGDRPGARHPSINSLAVTPDGRHVLSAGQLTVPPSLTALSGLSANVGGVTLSEVRLWDLASGERVKDLVVGEHQGTGSAALSRDGRRVVVADDDALRILDAATGQVDRTIALPRPGGARPAISPDGAVVAQSLGTTIGLFDVTSGRPLHHDERMPRDEPISAAWSPAGDRVVAGYRDGGIRLWDVAGGKLAWHAPLSPRATPLNSILIPNFVTFSRDGRLVVAAGGADTLYGKLGDLRGDERTRRARRRSARDHRGGALARRPDRRRCHVARRLRHRQAAPGHRGRHRPDPVDLARRRRQGRMAGPAPGCSSGPILRCWSWPRGPAT